MLQAIETRISPDNVGQVAPCEFICFSAQRKQDLLKIDSLKLVEIFLLTKGFHASSKREREQNMLLEAETESAMPMILLLVISKKRNTIFRSKAENIRHFILYRNI